MYFSPLRRQNLFTAAGCLLILLFFLTSCGPAFETEEDRSFVVVFGDAKGMHAWADVFLAGIRVGSVRSVDLVDMKVEVRILIDQKYQDQITTEAAFFIDSDPKLATDPLVRIKIKRAGGQPVLPGHRFKGVDSPLAWKFLGMTSDLDGLGHSEEIQEFLDKLNEWQGTFIESLNVIDL